MQHFPRRGPLLREPRTNGHGNPDEIDLSDLFDKLRILLGKSARGFLSVAARCWRGLAIRMRLLAVLWVIGLGMGLLYLVLTKEKYQGTIIVSSRYLNYDVLDHSIGVLNEMISSDSKKLGFYLDLHDSIIQSIIKIEVKKMASDNEITLAEKARVLLAEMKSDKLPAVEELKSLASIAELGSTSAVKIAVTLSKPVDEQSLQANLVQYIRESQYVRTRIDEGRKQAADKINELRTESIALDTLLKNVAIRLEREKTKRIREGSNNVILSEEPGTNPLEILDRMKTNFNETQSLHLQLATGSDFEVLEDLRIILVKDHKRFLKAVLISFLIPAIALAFILLVKVDRYLRNFR
jgi:hypothetical protein